MIAILLLTSFSTAAEVYRLEDITVTEFEEKIVEQKQKEPAMKAVFNSEDLKKMNLKNAWEFFKNIAGITVMETTLYHIRLPRIILVVAVGMALSGSGVSLQAIFRNPPVDPFIPGISAGAALGAALSMAFFPRIPVQVAAFVLGLTAVFLALFLARIRLETPIILLILTGIVVSSFFSASPRKETGCVRFKNRISTPIRMDRSKIPIDIRLVNGVQKQAL